MGLVRVAVTYRGPGLALELGRARPALGEARRALQVVPVVMSAESLAKARLDVIKGEAEEVKGALVAAG